MLAWTLNTKAENGSSSLRAAPSASRRGEGDGARSTMPSSSSPTPKLVMADPTNTGDCSPARNSSWSTCPASSSSSATSSARHLPGVALLLGRAGGIDDLGGGLGRAVRGAAEADEVAGAPVDQAAEVAGVAHRPGDGHRLQVEAGLDLVEQLEPVTARPVPLVDEGEQGHVARPAHLEQLERLRLDALGRVEHHHRGVDRGQHPVGVLGEVAVAGRVEQVEHVVAVRELQHGGGDRDAPLLLELHPVGAGAPPLTPGLDLTGLLHRPAVQQELLGEGGLARVGVADDGEGAAVRSELGDRGHATHQATAWLVEHRPSGPGARRHPASGEGEVSREGDAPPWPHSAEGSWAPLPAAPPVPANTLHDSRRRPRAARRIALPV